MENVQEAEKINHYALMLDESGEFTEGAKSTEPSIVAGILLKSEIPSEEWAWDYFRKVKASSCDYEKININSFHAKDDSIPRMFAFITDLLCALAEDDAEIVVFKNRKGGVIVNSDITYLNVFADGVAALVKELLQKDKGKISLDVFYAQRQAVCTLEINKKLLESVERQYKKRLKDLEWELKNVSKMAKEKYEKRILALEKEKEETRIRIEEDAYKRRIMERVELLLAKLPPHDQRRIERRVTLTIGQALTSHLLMLADAACYALRGAKRSFTPEQRQRISALPSRYFAVPETEAWQTIENCFQQNHYAEGIFLWYGGFYKELDRYKEEFQRQIVQYFQGTDGSEREAVTAILSQYLLQLVKNAHYELAESYITRMDTKFFPLIREHDVQLDRLYFDLHFFRLTIATHRGDYKTEREEIEICREALKHLPSTYETLDYYLKYKLREIEHLKNCYAFREALEKLEALENTFKSMMELVGRIDELGGVSTGMTSGTLGSVYGSMAMTHCFLGLSEPENFARAVDDFQKSLAQFPKAADRSRSYQSRAAAAYWSGQWSEALSFLSLAFTGDSNGDARTTLSAILKEKPLSRSFGMMHFSSVMARAMLAENPLGGTMWEAWQSLSPHLGEKDEYPVSINLWRLATCAALLNDERAEAWYQRAIGQSMQNLNAYASIAAGLTMQLERIALLPNEQTETYIKQFQEDYEGFMASEAPETMRAYFAPWQEFVGALSRDTVAKRKPEILRLVNSMPIL